MWHKAIYKMATMDVLISLADYAQNGDMCIPEIHDGLDGEVMKSLYYLLILFVCRKNI